MLAELVSSWLKNENKPRRLWGRMKRMKSPFGMFFVPPLMVNLCFFDGELTTKPKHWAHWQHWSTESERLGHVGAEDSNHWPQFPAVKHWPSGLTISWLIIQLWISIIDWHMNNCYCVRVLEELTTNINQTAWHWINLLGQCQVLVKIVHIFETAVLKTRRSNNEVGGKTPEEYNAMIAQDAARKQ